jgi:transcriptional regulator with XRE-family HTH domain
MSNTTDLIAINIRRLRELKKLSQKEVSAKSGVPQGQYSRIENGHVEPAVSTLEKLSKVFEVSITEFFKSNDMDEDINLPLLEKIKLIDTLDEDEKNALFKMIDLAISNKKMKDNLQQLIAS